MSFRGIRSPSCNKVLIAFLCPFRDLHFLISQLLDVIGVAGTTLVTFLRRHSGSQLHGPDFMGDKTGPSPTVIFLLGQHMPAQRSKLACHRNDGDLVVTARTDTDEKNPRSGPGALAAAQAASTSIARAWLRPALLIRP